MGSSVCKENTKQLSETWGKRQRIEIIMTKMCKETKQHDSDRQKEVWGGHIQHWKWARIQITLLNLHFQDERLPSCAAAIKPEHRQWTHNKAKRQTKNNQKNVLKSIMKSLGLHSDASTTCTLQTHPQVVRKNGATSNRSYTKLFLSGLREMHNQIYFTFGVKRIRSALRQKFAWNVKWCIFSH